MSSKPYQTVAGIDLNVTEWGIYVAVRDGWLKRGAPPSAELERLIASRLVERGPDGEPRLVDPPADQPQLL